MSMVLSTGNILPVHVCTSTIFKYPVPGTTISAFITNEAYIRSDSPFRLLEIYDTRDFLLGLYITHKLRARDYDADRFIFIDV